MPIMKLFVAGLPFDLGDQELNDIFSEYGGITSAKVITDRETGKSRGFGFVEFSDNAASQAAIKALNGAEVGGRTLVVREAEDRPKGGGDRDNNRGGGNFNRPNNRNRW
jgi:RNA recognition motif-containing protein